MRGMKPIKLYVLSIVYLSFSILLSLNQVVGITGFSTYDSSGLLEINILGIIFFFMAILLFMAGREDEGRLEKSLAKVYDASSGKSKDHDAVYTFVDPSGYRITLGEMKKQVHQFRQDNEGSELLKIMKEEYSPLLYKVVDNGEERDKEIAWCFLEVLGEKRSSEENDFCLKNEERREIYGIFHDWSGDVNPIQRKVLGRYNIYFDNSGKGHPKFRYSNTGHSVTTSSTPSDNRTGRNLATNIIHLIENARRAKYERQQREKEENEKKRKDNN